VIGRLQKTVIDCPEPRALAEFYCDILGLEIYESIHGRPADPAGWVVIGRDGRKVLAFQRSIPWTPPQYAETGTNAGVHLDIFVDDVDEAERVVLSLGAARVPHDDESWFRVFTDPVGHPFCLVFGSEFVDSEPRG
jgi:hypothetical protein